MITVIFFASIRERLETSQLSVEFDQGAVSVARLKDQLIANNGSAWFEVLNAANVVIAVNQEVVAESRSLVDGDEVAFFPPVTGG